MREGVRSKYCYERSQSCFCRTCSNNENNNTVLGIFAVVVMFLQHGMFFILSHHSMNMGIMIWGHEFRLLRGFKAIVLEQCLAQKERRIRTWEHWKDHNEQH